MKKADRYGVIDYDSQTPGRDMQENIKEFQAIFSGDDTVRYRMVRGESEHCVIFIDGMTSADIIDHYIIEPLARMEKPLLGEVKTGEHLFTHECAVTNKYSQAVGAVLSGDTVVLTEGQSEIYLLGTKGFQTRGIEEPDNEKALYGPREGFTESIMNNTAMLRRRLKTSDLKYQFSTIGTRTGTNYCLCYLDNLVNRDLLREVKRRLQTICSEGFTDSYGIAEQIKDASYSFFQTVGKTERPDMVAQKLLDGGVALMLDGTPVVMLMPYLLVENFKSCDDYYLGFYYASVSRLLRYLAFFVTVSIGAVYIATISMHNELLPTSFMLAISSATSGLPLPSYIEFTVMMLMFEMLRETGIRMSSKIGQSLSIVGALVVGQSAVEARIVSAPMLIVVALSAITGLMIPHMSSVAIVIRFCSVLAASLLGFFGYGLVMLALCVHLFSLESFGVQYTANILSLKKVLQDGVVRAPRKFLTERTKFMASDRQRRQ